MFIAALCAAMVLAAAVNAGVWFPPLGTVGIAVREYTQSVANLHGFAELRGYLDIYRMQGE